MKLKYHLKPEQKEEVLSSVPGVQYNRLIEAIKRSPIRGLTATYIGRELVEVDVQGKKYQPYIDEDDGMLKLSYNGKYFEEHSLKEFCIFVNQ